MRTNPRENFAAAMPALVELVGASKDVNEAQRCMVGPALEWFNAEPRRAQLLGDVLLPDGRGPSLRLVDHLVVQYAREKDVMVQHQGGVPVHLWTHYRRTLGSFGKRHFDVFKRRYHVQLRIGDKEVDATLGQLVSPRLPA